MKPRFRKLNENDSFYLRAAEGWFELGDFVSANNELDEISAEERTHPGVLIMRYEIYAKARKWDYAWGLANTLHKMLPDDPQSWINLAITARQKNGGNLWESKRILLDAYTRFDREYLIPYYLACYYAQLGELGPSKAWFQVAMARDEKAVQKIALDEPDLKPLWDSMSGTIWKKE